MTEKIIGLPCNRAWAQVNRSAPRLYGKERRQQGRRTELAKRVLQDDHTEASQFDNLLKAFSSFDDLKADQSDQNEIRPSKNLSGGHHAG